MRALQIDTRQQHGKHDEKDARFAELGVRCVRSKLAFGDYAAVPQASVDTKKDIYELVMDIDREHDRFRRELESARAAGCALTVLVENEDGVTDLASLAEWTESDAHYRLRKRSGGDRVGAKVSGARIAKACATMEARYGVRFEFCEPGAPAADRIIEIVKEADDGEHGE